MRVVKDCLMTRCRKGVTAAACRELTVGVDSVGAPRRPTAATAAADI
jgi:hypothetical protein